MSTAQARASSTSTVECAIPIHTQTSVSGTKTRVESQSGGLRYRSTKPMTTARAR